MPFVVAIVAGAVAGFIRGGRFPALAALRFRQPWLLSVAVLLWLASSPLPTQRWLHLSDVAPLLQSFADLLLLLFIWQNRHVPWLLLVGVGLFANWVVMAANGGQMPLDPALLDAMGGRSEVASLAQQGYWLHIRLMGPETRLPFLGDVLYLGPPFPWPRILSPGDILIAAAAFLVVYSAMARAPASRISAT